MPTSFPPRAACRGASPGTRTAAAWWAGRRTARMCSSPAARQLPAFRAGSSAFMPTAPAFPSRCPCPPASRAPSRPTASRIAYEPFTKWQPAWKRYVGGQTTPIWIVNLKTLDLVKVPRDNSNDSNPVWVGDQVYFLSDRDSRAPVSLFRYDIASQAGQPGGGQHRPRPEVLPGRARGGAGLLSSSAPFILVDTATNADQVVPIQIHGELASLAPHLATLTPDEIQNAALSPTGARAVFEAHGEIFTVPGRKRRHPQPDPDPRRGRAQPFLEPGRQDHRLLLRRLRRVPALPARPDRLQAAHGHRPRPRAQLLLQPHLVARLQAHRLRRQTPAPVGVCDVPGGQAGAGGSRHLRQLRLQLQRRLVAGLEVDRLSPRPRQPVERHLPLLAWRRTNPPR